MQLIRAAARSALAIVGRHCCRLRRLPGSLPRARAAAGGRRLPPSRAGGAPRPRARAGGAGRAPRQRRRGASARARACRCHVTEAEVARPVDGSGRVRGEARGRAARGGRCDGWTWVRVRVVAPVAVATRACARASRWTTPIATEERELRAGHTPGGDRPVVGGDARRGRGQVARRRAGRRAHAASRRAGQGGGGGRLAADRADRGAAPRARAGAPAPCCRRASTSKASWSTAAWWCRAHEPRGARIVAGRACARGRR